MSDTKNITLKDEKVSVWFVSIVAIFVTSLITANIIAVKLAQIGGVVFPVGVIIFPISYIIGDVLTEVYGFHRARLVIWLGFLCNFLTVGAIWIAQILPPAQFWQGQEAFEQILGYVPRILLASFLAYLVGEFSNSFVLAKLKIITAGKWLWVRTIGSTLVGQGFDSIIFISVAFIGSIPIAGLLSAIVTQWLMKSIYEALATPFTYVVVNYLKKIEGVDVFDHDTDFNPLRVSN